MGTHAFQAEVGRVLSLVINSLYSNKEIFLRELVSNASDALDKLRFRSLTEPALLEGEPELVIRLRVEPEARVLVIEDTGIGMTEAELVENLGTVAKSGSAAFIEKLEAGAKKDVSIIGQFGVGFYSAYLVADRVEVVSRAAGTDKAWKWTSTGRDTFEVEPAERAARGTELRLFLKEEHAEMLEPWRLRDLVRRYSDYVAYPIELETRDAEKPEEPPQRETINRGRALWQRPKNEITDEQYEELYKHLTHDWEPPVARTHFRVEGTQEFVGLFWVPKNPPFDLDDPRKQRGVRLFVKRVLVMEDCEAILPQWLRFVRGLVDSDDLPLNVSRELLQESTTLKTIKKQVTKRALDLLDEIAKDKAEDYKAVWASFGRILKEGLAVDPEWKERIATLTRWSSTYVPEGGSADDLVSLDDYIARMKEGQDAIYYVTGESREALSRLRGPPHDRRRRHVGRRRPRRARRQEARQRDARRGEAPRRGRREAEGSRQGARAPRRRRKEGPRGPRPRGRRLEPPHRVARLPRPRRRRDARPYRKAPRPLGQGAPEGPAQPRAQPHASRGEGPRGAGGEGRERSEARRLGHAPLRAVAHLRRQPARRSERLRPPHDRAPRPGRVLTRASG